MTINVAQSTCSIIYRIELGWTVVVMTRLFIHNIIRDTPCLVWTEDKCINPWYLQCGQCIVLWCKLTNKDNLKQHFWINPRREGGSESERDWACVAARTGKPSSAPNCANDHPQNKADNPITCTANLANWWHHKGHHTPLETGSQRDHRKNSAKQNQPIYQNKGKTIISNKEVKKKQKTKI